MFDYIMDDNEEREIDILDRLGYLHHVHQINLNDLRRRPK